MKSFIFATMLAGLVAGTAQAQLVELPESPAINETIQSQIDAFRADDFATAFSYASPTIKGLFGSPDRFGLMVRNGYPMVWRPDEVQFLGLRQQDGRLWQKVMVVDMAGNRHVLDYQMIETPEGWQINGVHLLPQPGVGV